jgi:membrane associated rhomboid family serine protease
MYYPPLERWHRYPVTVGIILSAMALSVWTDFGKDFHRGDLQRGVNLLMGDELWSGEIWRPFSSCLFHGSIVHLVFNVMCFWVFGAVFEEIWGSGRTLSVMLFLAFVSSVAQYAFDMPGIGLSGILYGLFGLLWVLSRKDRRFFGTLDRQTVRVLVGWFFLCIVASHVDESWRIGNTAHGSGAIMGAMLGYAIVEKNKARKIAYSALLAATTLGIIAAGSSVGRKYVNFSKEFKQQRQWQAYQLQLEGWKAYYGRKYEEAADLYSKALAIDDSHAECWYNLGNCYLHLHQEKKAGEAFRRAAQLKPDEEAYHLMSQKYGTPEN